MIHQAETLKYFYLLFSPSNLLPLNSIVINTEAHIFPRFELSNILKTGWERKPRDSDGKIIKPKGKIPKSKTEVEKGRDESSEPSAVRTVKVVETKRGDA